MELFPYVTLTQSGEVVLGEHVIAGTVTRRSSGDYSSFADHKDSPIVRFL